MDLKNVGNFLLLKPAFSGRNLTSLALVAVFFGVYVAAGGKVSSIPQVEATGGFGGIELPAASGTKGSVPDDKKAGSITSSLTEDLKDLALPEREDDPAPKRSALALGERDTKSNLGASELAVEDEVNADQKSDPEDQLAEIEKRLKSGRRSEDTAKKTE